MKRKMFLFLFFVSLIFASCEFVEFEAPIDEQLIEETSNIVLKSAEGYSSVTGLVYVQQNVGSVLKVESKTTTAIESATWQVEGATYEGTHIAHRFTTLGEVILKVTAQFTDGTTEVRSFTVHSVLDISGVDPVKVFTYQNTDGSWKVLFLINKERIRHATSNTFYYVGDMTNWVKVQVPEADRNYVIDKNGNPQLTSDVGMYTGFSVNLTETTSYKVAFVHSETSWADLSGSSFVKSTDPGLILFWFDNGEVTPQGEIVATNLPGDTGDKYFRFSVTGDNVNGKVKLYWRLDDGFTPNAYVTRQLPGGEYSGPITMWEVPGHSEWGVIELPIAELLNSVSGFRYGPNKSEPHTYSAAMKNSFFYDTYFKNLRIAIYKI